MQVWYCVSPKDRSKFEDMAKGLFPELHNICPAFLRHKDILLSPKTLRNHHINYVQASVWLSITTGIPIFKLQHVRLTAVHRSCRQSRKLGSSLC